jgi:hypothetical protein
MCYLAAGQAWFTTRPPLTWQCPHIIAAGHEAVSSSPPTLSSLYLLNITSHYDGLSVQPSSSFISTTLHMGRRSNLAVK